ncbi:MAG: family 78 glycoside hydrolase catalytic domain, partial [Microbacterium sp.]|uniref:family 78 glycoside hydrolase catalytic domain n=1 Tax=Microbacterium sp. TaxID=51671 RepID=UPI003F9C85AB
MNNSTSLAASGNRRSAFARIGAAAVAATLTVSLLLVDGTVAHAAPTDSVAVVGLKADNRATPLGVAAEDPALSWRLDADDDARGIVQSAYQVRVAKSEAEVADATVWDSGKVDSDQSVAVLYGGPALESQTRYHWQVRVWDGDGVASGWSEPSWFETGILDNDEWEGEWIGGEDPAAKLADWKDYTVTAEFTLDPGTAFGMYFRATGVSAANNGNAYMWQLNDEVPGNPRLRPHEKNNGGYSTTSEVNLTDKGLAVDVLTQRGTLEITATGTTFETRLNGVLVDTRTDDSFASGHVGFRTSASSTAMESVVIHSLKVESPTKTLIDTDFSDGNPFSGGTVGPEGLTVEGNHDILVEQKSSHPLLRKEFSVDSDKTVTSARVYATARGIYELSLNGSKVGDLELAPGWTDYSKRIAFQTYDVTEQIASGTNTIGAMLAPGWYSGRLAHVGNHNYGTRDSLIAQLRVDYSDGSSEVIATDDTWRTAPGPFAAADLIDGETYIAADAQPGWNTNGFNDTAWATPWVAPSATSVLEPQREEPVRVTGIRPALERTEPEDGAFVYDVGQNMVGVANMKLTGTAGSTVRIRYAEELNPDGTMYVANLRSAKATDYYTFAEDGTIEYEPTFTFHGFRYIEITGVSTAPEVEDVTGIVRGSDLAFIGDIETSSAMLNQLQSNITWGQRGNFLSIPTDTPARDERMGWSGDINVFAPTAVYNMDSLNFLSKWLVDLQDGQNAAGDYHGVAPYTPSLACCGGGTGWSDAGITVPWVLWQSYGSTKPIREGYASMTRYMDYLATSYPSMVRGSTYADWLHLDDPTPGDVLGTAYYAYVSRLMSEMAAAIGEDADAAHYAELADRGASVFAEEFIAEDGSITGDSQAGYAIALGMKLVPEEQRDDVADQFLETLERRDFHLATGFLGTPWLVPALSESGHLDMAYRLLLNDTFPSWGYEVAMGATTMWERWDSINPDGSFGDVSMNSFNHYAYGAIGDWMYRNIGAIASESPGYKHSIIAPNPGGGISHANASYESVYGTIATKWEQSGKDFTLSVTIPENTSATVVLPAESAWAVTEGGNPVDEVDGVTGVGTASGKTSVEVGSGHYDFAVDGSILELGALLDELAKTDAEIDSLESDSALSEANAEELRGAVDAITETVHDAVSQLREGDTAQAIAGLATVTADLADFEQRIAAQDNSAAAEKALQKRVYAMRDALSDAVAAIADVSSDLRVVSGVASPGSVVSLELDVHNGSDVDLNDVSAAFASAEKWELTPVAAAIEGSIAPGATGTLAFTAIVPADAKPDSDGTFSALATFERGDDALLSTASTTIAVSSPLTIGESVVAPDTVSADGLATITVPVTNSGTSPVLAAVEAALPAGWGSDARSAERLAAPGDTVEFTIEVAVPLTVSAYRVELPLTALRGDVSMAEGKVTVPVGFDAAQYDHVDLGNDSSESAHKLTAHPSSGTSNEAGLSRRYSHGGVPGSWFEFDVNVEPGEPFAVDVVETYERTLTKQYTVTANGALVHSQEHESDAGATDYSFVVNDPSISESGTVRLRFERGEDDSLGDPSIADVYVRTLDVIDHVDLGHVYSEARHDLAAAPSSGTSTEAGLTRRYSGATTPGSWFEFDVDIVRGEPFLIRGLETYDKAQTKDYAITVDGVAVNERTITRTEGAVGTMAYQVLVDDPALLDADRVTVRMQKSDTGSELYDPSIADVWILPVNADTQAPIVAASVDSAHMGSDGWFLGDATVTLSAQDNRSGALELEWAIGDGDFASYSEPIEISTDGISPVRYRAVDAAGNTSEIQEVEVRIDTTAPAGVLELSPAANSDGWLQDGATAAITATDDGSGVDAVEYRFDGGAWQQYSAAVALPHGEYDIEYRVRDVAGNLSAVGIESVRVDTGVPEVEALVSGTPGSGDWLIDHARVSLVSSDNGSGIANVEYRLNAGEWRAYKAPVP